MRKNLFLTLIVLSIVIIGASAMFALANRPSLQLSGGSPADVEVLARVIARGEDRIAPTELADWIVQDRKNVQATAATAGQETSGPVSEISTPFSPQSSVLNRLPRAKPRRRLQALKMRKSLRSPPPLTPATEAVAPAGGQQGSDEEGTLIVDEGC